MNNYLNLNEGKTSPVNNLEVNGFISLCDWNYECFWNSNYNSRSWNKYMHYLNGNRKSCINVGHWNGGPSHLGNSTRGLDKLNSIKELIADHNLDILGVSEANPS